MVVVEVEVEDEIEREFGPHHIKLLVPWVVNPNNYYLNSITNYNRAADQKFCKLFLNGILTVQTSFWRTSHPTAVPRYWNSSTLTDICIHVIPHSKCSMCHPFICLVPLTMFLVSYFRHLFSHVSWYFNPAC